jgi:hypothetical protein
VAEAVPTHADNETSAAITNRLLFMAISSQMRVQGSLFERKNCLFPAPQHRLALTSKLLQRYGSEMKKQSPIFHSFRHVAKSPNNGTIRCPRG